LSFLLLLRQQLLRRQLLFVSRDQHFSVAVYVSAAAAARYLMWVLEDIGEMNAMGVERMIRSLALLQVRGAKVEMQC
jgi:hypothetical protein